MCSLYRFSFFLPDVAEQDGHLRLPALEQVRVLLQVAGQVGGEELFELDPGRQRGLLVPEALQALLAPEAAPDTQGSAEDVEAAAKISAQFAQDKDNDGLLGLAFSTINTVKPQKATTWFDTAVKAGQLTEPIFGVRLEHQKAGSYDFGFADTKAFTGNMAYADIDSSQGFWEFKTDGFAVGDKTTNTPIQGIADTGTTLIYVPAAVVKAYYAGVQGVSQTQGMYVFPCNTQLPDFSIIVSGQKITTPGEYVNYQPVDKAGSQCLGGIQPNDGLQGLSIFGDVILKNNYVVFDAKVPRIGWAAKSS